MCYFLSTENIIKSLPWGKAIKLYAAGKNVGKSIKEV